MKCFINDLIYFKSYNKLKIIKYFQEIYIKIKDNYLKLKIFIKIIKFFTQKHF